MLVNARRLLGDGQEAEDVVQEAMLKLWLMRDGLEPPLSGMASVIVRNLCIDSLRRRKTFISTDFLAEAEEPGDNSEQIERMMQQLDALPSAQRTILRMRYLEGRHLSEIAQITGSSEVAVRKSLSRARSNMRRRMIAALAAACIVLGISVMSVRWLLMERENRQQEECVSYVYGKKQTDPQTVMQELNRTMGSIAQDDTQQEIENQLNELFKE